MKEATVVEKAAPKENAPKKEPKAKAAKKKEVAAVVEVEEAELEAELEPEDIDVMSSSDPSPSCCLLACTSRGQPCLTALVVSMEADLEPEEQIEEQKSRTAQPEPGEQIEHRSPAPDVPELPSAANTPPRASRRARNGVKSPCGCHDSKCYKSVSESEKVQTCWSESLEATAELAESLGDVQSPENLKDEVITWTESTGETPAEIWGTIEDDDGCPDGCDEIASTSRRSGDSEPVEAGQ